MRKPLTQCPDCPYWAVVESMVLQHMHERHGYEDEDFELIDVPWELR